MMKNYKKVTTLTNAIDPASTTSKDWGFIPIPGKGGKTNNLEHPEWFFLRELEDQKEGGAVNA